MQSSTILILSEAAISSLKDIRINSRIRISPVRLIGPNGEQIGIVPVIEALQRAQDLTLDLVEVSPDSRPPVCRIMDFGKYKYEMSKKEKVAKKKQHIFQLKEMRYRPKIDDHDFDFKTRHLRTFLEEGSKVRVMVQFRGREMAHQEFGQVIMDRVLAALGDVANPEGYPKMEGNTLAVTLNPKTEVFKRAQALRTKPAAAAKPADAPAATADKAEKKKGAPSPAELPELPEKS